MQSTKRDYFRDLRIGASMSALTISMIMSAAQAQSETSPPVQAPTPSSTAAQDASSHQGGLQDIVVTARRVEERLQNVPLSITALSGSALADRQITQARDLKGQISNVNTLHTSTPGNLFIAIRGLNSGTLPGIEFDNRVGVYLDGVYIARAQGGSFTLADIDRVEVLKGPQGTLFGHNSTAGAISFTTSHPTGKFDGTVEAGFGSFSRQRYRASIDLPSFANISLHFGYVHDQNDGDIKNLAGGRQYGPFVNAAADFNLRGDKSVKREGGFKNDTFFAAARYDGIDGLVVDYKFDYARNIEDPETGQVLGYAGTFVGCSGAVVALGLQYNCGQFPGTAGIGLNTTAAPITSTAANHVPIGFKKQHELYNDLTGPNHINNWGHSLTINYQATDNLTLKSITGYRNLHVKGTQDLDGGDIYAINAVYNGTAAAVGGIPTPLTASGLTPYCLSCSVTAADSHQFSEEFQAVAKLGNLDLLGGLYYFREHGTSQNFYVANFNPFFAAAGAGLPPLLSTSNVLPNSEFANGDLASATSVSRAIFGRATWHVTDKLDLVAGGRYTQDRKHNIIDPVLADLIDTDPTTIGIQPPPLDAKVGFNKFTYEGTATYKFTSDINIFARYTTAYLSGGLYRNEVFKPETAKDVEIGLRSEWLDHRVRFNLTAFAQSSKNLQLPTNAPPFGTLVIENIGTAKTKGFEAELVVAPATGLTVGANVGYTHQKYSDGTQNLAPPWTISLNATYDTPKFGNGMFIEIQADSSYSTTYHSIAHPLTSAAFGNVDGTVLPSALWASYGSQTAYLEALDHAANLGGYWLANARISLADIPLGPTKARLSGYVKNLTNSQHITYSQNYGTNVLGVFEQDRTFGVDLRVNF
jgi:iron complex outermembrane receptor protein